LAGVHEEWSRELKLKVIILAIVLVHTDNHNTMANLVIPNLQTSLCRRTSEHLHHRDSTSTNFVTHLGRRYAQESSQLLYCYIHVELAGGENVVFDNCTVQNAGAWEGEQREAR
jgi:hypothetical protein